VPILITATLPEFSFGTYRTPLGETAMPHGELPPVLKGDPAIGTSAPSASIMKADTEPGVSV
jgi:hypothetical protein